MNAVIAWTVQQVFRVRNLPHREIRAKENPKRDLVRAVTAEMLRGGEVEVMEQGWQRPNQYRRAR